MKQSAVIKKLLELISETTPSGSESYLVEKMGLTLEKDLCGNYYKIIGDNPKVMFTSHLDNACTTKQKVNFEIVNLSGINFIKTDGNTILGADDKAGVVLMINMINNNVPGLYYFFISEEIGSVGSSCLSENYDKYDFLNGINQCVSFDRKNTNSIITHQNSLRSCSDEYANELMSQLNKSGLKYKLDPTGRSSDSFEFINHIPECTNISVGYKNEHKKTEMLNITFIDNLSEALLKVEWDKLPIKTRENDLSMDSIQEKLKDKYDRIQKRGNKIIIESENINKYDLYYNISMILKNNKYSDLVTELLEFSTEEGKYVIRKK